MSSTSFTIRLDKKYCQGVPGGFGSVGVGELRDGASPFVVGSDGDVGGPFVGFDRLTLERAGVAAVREDYGDIGSETSDLEHVVGHDVVSQHAAGDDAVEHVARSLSSGCRSDRDRDLSRTGCQ
jgi:hypothetical protein